MNRFNSYRYFGNFGQKLQTGGVSIYGFGTIFVEPFDETLNSLTIREREREREK